MGVTRPLGFLKREIALFYIGVVKPMQIFKLNWKSDVNQGSCGYHTHLVVYLSWFKVRLCDEVSNVVMVWKLALNPYNRRISLMKSLLIKKVSDDLCIKDSA